MCRIYSLTSALFILLALINTGLALQCWTCDSEFDSTCGNNFNVTKFKQNKKNINNFNYGGSDPYLELCTESLSNNEKTICLKRVYRGTRTQDIPVVQRKCITVSRKLAAGECPKDLSSEKDRIIIFCSGCEFDYCNTATGIKNNIKFAALPTILFLLHKYYFFIRL